MLFKVADSINPVTAASVQVVGHDEVEGQVSSGQFCGTGNNYTLHFVALFDRPFSSAGDMGQPGPPREHRMLRTTCGSYVTFDTTTERSVLMKVGISFVSTDDALQNLRVGGSRAGRCNRSARRRSSGGTHSSGASRYTVARRLSSTPSTRRCTTRSSFPNVVSDVIRPLRRERRQGPYGR